MEKFATEIQSPIGWINYHLILRPGKDRALAVLQELRQNHSNATFRLVCWLGEPLPDEPVLGKIRSPPPLQDKKRRYLCAKIVERMHLTLYPKNTSTPKTIRTERGTNEVSLGVKWGVFG
jgi:hypothetical protein